MRSVITLNKNKQEAGNAEKQVNTEQHSINKPAGQPAVQTRQNKLNRQHQPYSEQEHETVSLKDWSGNPGNVELAEEDMNDPDLAVDFSGNRGYMLQPG